MKLTLNDFSQQLSKLICMTRMQKNPSFSLFKKWL